MRFLLIGAFGNVGESTLIAVLEGNQIVGNFNIFRLVKGQATKRLLADSPYYV